MPGTMNDILAVIMGGGRGQRLYPLTKMRSKPAVPIVGQYRLIDIPISNSINSEIYRVAVLTQFNSVSLHRHITQTYNFDRSIRVGFKSGPPSRPLNRRPGIKVPRTRCVSSCLKFNPPEQIMF